MSRLRCAGAAAALLLYAALPGCRGPVIPPELLATDGPGTSSLSPASPLRFRDVAAAAGVDFRHQNGAAGELNFPETMGSGCAFVDYDGDGRQDLFFVNGRFLRPRADVRQTPVLYRNNGDGTFTDRTAGSGLEQVFFGMGCAVGDYDGDGRPDLYVTAALDGSRLFRNLGGGRFAEVASDAGVRNAGRFGSSAAWLDFDRDGRLDLWVCNYVRYEWGDYPRCRAREAHRTYCNPHGFPPETSRLFRNLGNGRFRDVSRETGISGVEGKALGVLVFDFDEDGWSDVMVACDTTRNLLFRNHRGRFREVALSQGCAIGESGRPRAGMGIDVAYPWNDDRLAVLVGNFTNEGLAFFVRGHRSGAFLDEAGNAGLLGPSRLFLTFGLGFADLDNDSRRDIVAVNGHVDPWVGEHTAATYAERHLLFHNSGEGRFTETAAGAGPAFTSPRVSRGMSVGDYDGDGRLDVVVSNNGQPAELLRNETERAGHWIQVELEGTRSNRSGIGALVRVEAGGVTQRDWVRSGSSYCSQSMLPLHFGLGDRNRVDRLEVRWPSGAVDRYRDLTADRRIRLREGAKEPLPR